jgi:hypothetical protein
MDLKSYVQDLERIAAQRDAASKEAEELFQRRIMTMMRDYQISMGEALMWDYEGFENDIAFQMKDGTLEADFDFYLWQNNVYGSDIGTLCREIFFGREQDLVVRPLKGKDINTHNQ